jgi:hypothetical protein
MNQGYSTQGAGEEQGGKMEGDEGGNDPLYSYCHQEARIPNIRMSQASNNLLSSTNRSNNSFIKELNAIKKSYMNTQNINPNKGRE